MIPVARPSLGAEESRAVEEVFRSGWLGQGATTRAFEEALETYLGRRHVLAVNSGTSALHIALSAFGVGAGDEVIVPSLTFAACIQVILATGATPVFCESDASTLSIDVDDVARRLTPRTKVVMPVHYGGTPCDMDALLTLAERHRVRVIDDAAHAFGSTQRGRRVGSFGHATSPYPRRRVRRAGGASLRAATPIVRPRHGLPLPLRASVPGRRSRRA